jgi:hypothetical protein
VKEWRLEVAIDHRPFGKQRIVSNCTNNPRKNKKFPHMTKRVSTHSRARTELPANNCETNDEKGTKRAYCDSRRILERQEWKGNIDCEFNGRFLPKTNDLRHNSSQRQRK